MPKKLCFIAFIAAVSLVIGAAVVPVYADKCKDPIVDEVNAVDAGSKERLQAAMNALTQVGADARVMFLSSFHRDANNVMHKSLADYKMTMLAKCRSWQAPDGGFKNNLIVFIAVPQKSVSAVYYGSQWTRALEPNESRYKNDMAARFREKDLVGGMLVGLQDVTDLISVKPSQEGKPVVINHPTDYSGLWNIFGWILGFTILGFLGWLAYWIFGQNEKRRAAQRAAITERGKCNQALNTIDGMLAILKSKISQTDISPEWKTRINGTLDRAERTYRDAASTFNGLNRSANNPETPRLSVAEYSAIEYRYSAIAALFSKAEGYLDEAEELFSKASRGEAVPEEKTPHSEARPPKLPVMTFGVHQSKTFESPSRSRRGKGTKIPDHQRDETVIVAHPIIINEKEGSERPQDDRWAHERRMEPDKPVISKEPSRGSGQEIDWGESGKGGGSEMTWGSSGSGGGSEKSFDLPNESLDRSGTQY